MRRIGLTLFFLLIPHLALADNVATISFGCAPWDGKSLLIKVNAFNSTYNITIWGKGLEALKNGATSIEINNAEGVNSSSSGFSQVCDNGKDCHAEDTDIAFTKLDLRRGGEVRGSIKGTISFEGTISQDKSFCG